MNFKSKKKYFQAGILICCFIFSFLLQFNNNKNATTFFSGNIPAKSVNRIKSGLPKSDQPGQAIKWFYEQRAFPQDVIPDDWRERAIEHIYTHNFSKSNNKNRTWSGVGPHNIGGRVRSIAISNLNPSIIYAGSVSGGIFKSTNSGSSWDPITDDAPNLAISSIVIDPGNNNIIYAGTGEGFFNYDAVRGDGVLKSTNGGSTWTILKNFINSQTAHYFINDLYLRSDSTNIIYAATNQGLFRTTNAGNSWSFLHQGTSSRATQIAADSANPSVFYVCYGNLSTDGIYKTTNGGSTFIKLSTGFPTSGYNRISLAISKSNPNILYASLDSMTTHYTHSIQKSTNGGNSWFSVGKPSDPILTGSHLGGQGWYNNVIAVHPQNANVVFAGGVNLYKSTNGGVAWSMIGFGYPPSQYGYIHVDHHVIKFHPMNSSTMYFGTDGGVFQSTNGGSSFTELNNGFSTTQFYSGAIHPTLNIFYGGTQDNGTVKSAILPNWTMVFGGDGGATAVDFVNPSIVYTEYINLNIQKSTNAGATWVKSMNGIPTKSGATDGTTDRVLFIAPLVMDPNTPTTLVAGTYRLFRSTNGATSWTNISGDLTGDGTGESGAKISAITIAKGNSSVIFVGTNGSVTSNSRVMLTTNTGTTWSTVSKAPLPNRYITSFAIDESNLNRVWVGYSGYNTNTPSTLGHIYRTTNQGQTWTDVSGDLPDIPVNRIILNPTNPLNLLVGTDLGIFETANGGINWVQINGGMANVVIADLDLRNDGHVFAATHGRGMFKTNEPLTFVIPLDTIYPGDSNNDKDVDARDLLPIGRFYRQLGSPRINASLNWSPQTLSGAFLPIEAAYADCDGNGTVDSRDVLGIIQNWRYSRGQLIPPYNDKLKVCEELLDILRKSPSTEPNIELQREIMQYRSTLVDVPDDWILEQNYPNPFNSETKIVYGIPRDSDFIEIIIYDINGRIIKSDKKTNILSGYYLYRWNGSDSDGKQVSSGIYIFTISSQSIKLKTKMVLVR